MIQISQVEVDPELVDDEGPVGSDADYDAALPDYDDSQFELPEDYEYTEEDDDE